MRNLYEHLIKFLKLDDKESALRLCMEALEKDEISVVELYEQVLVEALNSIIEEYNVDVESLIWKEHVRSGIIRTIIESAYPYVLKEREKWGDRNLGNVLVICPQFEEHELGARMVADFFTIAGYKVNFIGANTPENTIIKAIEVVRPKYLCISVTNHYNLVATKKMIENIKNKGNKNIVFLLGGRAFLSDPSMYKQAGGDRLLKTFEDILNLGKDVMQK